MSGCFLNPLTISAPILSTLLKGRLKRVNFNYLKGTSSLQAPVVYDRDFFLDYRV